VAESDDTLKKRVKKAIEESGLPLEMHVGHILRSAGWWTKHSPLYFDLEDLQNKEYDLFASKWSEHFETRLYLECKHAVEPKGNEKKNWVFFAPEKYELIMARDLKYFPLNPKIQPDLTLLKDTCFNVLSKFCDNSEVALNSHIVQLPKEDKDKAKYDDPTRTRDAIQTTAKALMIDNINTHSPVPLQPVRPRMNFAIVVFDGPMFVYVQKDLEAGLERREYVKYKHDLNFSLWTLPQDLKQSPLLGQYVQYEHAVGTKYIVEVVHKDHFANYLEDLDESIAQLNRMPAEEFKQRISRWFVPRTG
jgi:hypothetical protein